MCGNDDGVNDESKFTRTYLMTTPAKKVELLVYRELHQDSIIYSSRYVNLKNVHLIFQPHNH